MNTDSAETSTSKILLEELSNKHNHPSPFIICASGGKVVAQVCGEVFVVDTYDSSDNSAQSITFKSVDINYPTSLLGNSITTDSSTITYVNLQQPEPLQDELLLLNGIDEEYSQTSDTPLEIAINEQPNLLHNFELTETSNHSHSALVINKNGSIVYTPQKENNNNYALEYHLNDFIVGNDKTLMDILSTQNNAAISKDQWLDGIATNNKSSSKDIITDTDFNHLFDELIKAITNDTENHI